jgi:hypothetical protein
MINRQATGFVCVVPSSGHTTFPGGPRMSLARFMASSVPPTLVRGRLEGFHSVGRARGEQTSLSVVVLASRGTRGVGRCSFLASEP